MMLIPSQIKPGQDSHTTLLKNAIVVNNRRPGRVTKRLRHLRHLFFRMISSVFLIDIANELLTLQPSSHNLMAGSNSVAHGSRPNFSHAA